MASDECYHDLGILGQSKEKGVLKRRKRGEGEKAATIPEWAEKRRFTPTLSQDFQCVWKKK